MDAAKQRLAETRTRPAPALSAIAPPEAPPPVPGWESAEAEKARLHAAHVANASETVDAAGPSTSATLPKVSSDQPPAAPALAASTSSWASAAAEKKRLYDEAVRARGEDPDVVYEVAQPILPDPSTRPAASPPLSATATSPVRVTSPISPTTPRLSWPTAEEEKERLYRAATAAQAGPRSETPPITSRADEKRREATPPPYPSAGEEKERLYDSAVEARPARRALFPPQLGSEQSAVEACACHVLMIDNGVGADVFADQAAIAERERWAASSSGSTSLPMPRPGPPEAGPSTSRPPPPVPSFSRSAADEKAALAARYRSEELASSASSSTAGIMSEEERRYREAVAARDRVQADLVTPPASPPMASSSSTEPPRYDVPPAAAAPGPISEKEQMARYYAAQEEVAARQRERATSPRGSLANVTEHEELPSFTSSVAPLRHSQPPASASASYAALNEKEVLARYYAAQEQGSSAAGAANLPGAYIATPDLDADRQLGGMRRPSTASSSESGTIEEPRDPAIALGKRRAETASPAASPPTGSLAYAASPPMGSSAGWSQRTSVYGYGLPPTSSSPVDPIDRFASPPPRPPKVPLQR
jgi:hypothetical protein